MGRGERKTEARASAFESLASSDYLWCRDFQFFSYSSEGSTLSARIRALSAQQNAPKAKDDIQTDGIRAAFQKDDLPEVSSVRESPRRQT